MSAAIDTYVESELVGSPREFSNAFNCDGTVIKCVYVKWTKGTESDGTIYRLFKSMPANIIPLQILFAGAANAGLTEVDLGLYEERGGPVIIKDCLADGINVAAGAANFKEATAFDLLSAKAGYANLQKRLFEYAGHDLTTPPRGGYDIALTCNVAGATGSTVHAVRMIYAQG